MEDPAGEGHVEVGAQIADGAHQQHEQQRGGKLQQEFRPGGQAGILVAADLLPVVQKADGAEHTGEEQHEDVHELAVQHPLEAHREADEGRREDEHDAAHRGGARLAVMPGGAVVLDLLPRFLPAEPGDIEFSEGRREAESQHKRADQLYRHRSLSISGFVSSKRRQRSRAHPCGASQGLPPGSPRGLCRQAILHHRDAPCQ